MQLLAQDIKNIYFIIFIGKKDITQMGACDYDT